MKGDTFIGALAKKAGITDPNLEAKISALSKIDLPDELEPILGTLMSEEAAKQNAELGQFYRQRIDDEYKREDAGKLRALGIDGEELDKYLALSPAQRIEAVHQRATQIAREQAGKTESQIEAEYKQKLEAEKQRAAQLEKIAVQKDEDAKAQVANELAKVHTREFVRGAKIQTNLPEEAARRLLMDEFQTRVASAGGQVVCTADGKVLIRKADDKNAQVYDSRNNPLDAQTLLNETIQSLNMRPVASANTNAGGKMRPGDVPLEKVNVTQAQNAQANDYKQRLERSLAEMRAGRR